MSCPTKSTLSQPEVVPRPPRHAPLRFGFLTYIDYMVNGKDGYTALSVAEGSEVVVDEENGVLISTILRQYFLSLKVLGRWSRGGFYRNFFDGMKQDMKSKGALVQSEAAQQHEEHGDDDQDSDSESENDGLENAVPAAEGPIKRMADKWARLAGVKTSDDRDVDWTSCISPKIEGRIVEVTVEQE